MRLWDYRLLPYLDNIHIQGQWRELLAIKGAIDKNGTPNHRLVNKVLDYNIQDFKDYTVLVICEMQKRNIKFSKQRASEIAHWENNNFNNNRKYVVGELYTGWHNNKYLRQCFFNLQEKFDCGIVSPEAWGKIVKYCILSKEIIELDYVLDLRTGEITFMED